MSLRPAPRPEYQKSVMLTDCRSLFDHVYSMTGNTAEILIPDIHELREAAMPWRSHSNEYSDNHVELWWCDTVRQLADNLTKLVTPSAVEFFNLMISGVIRLGVHGTKTYEKPRPSQRAHSMMATAFEFLKTWDDSECEQAAVGFEQERSAAVCSVDSGP